MPREVGPSFALTRLHTNFHTLADGFWAFGELLRRDGYVTRPNETRFTLESLRECRILVIANAQPGSPDWNSYPYPTPSAFQLRKSWPFVHGSRAADHYS